MKSNSLLITFIVAASLLAGTPLRAQTSAQNNQARSLFLEGCDLWDEGNFVAAERKFRDALIRYPKADQSDRTSYYLITTLINLGRADEARAEILNFYKAYPHSTWRSDVEEKRLMLSEPSRTAFRGQQVSRGSAVPPGQYRIVIPNPFPANLHMPPSPSLEQEQLRIIVQTDANKGIAVARERLKVNPSDPAVISNFVTIAGSGSPHAFPFFVVLAGKGPSPHTRDQARFWIGRLKNENDAVGKGLVEIVKEKDGVPIVVEVFSRINPAATQNLLNQVIQVPSAEKLDALEKIYKSTTVQPVRSQIVQSAGSMSEPAARDFLTEVAKTESNVSIRLAAIHTLSMRPDVDVKTLEDILKTLIGKVPVRPGVQPETRGDDRELQTTRQFNSGR